VWCVFVVEIMRSLVFLCLKKKNIIIFLSFFFFARFLIFLPPLSHSLATSYYSLSFSTRCARKFFICVCRVVYVWGIAQSRVLAIKDFI